MKIAATFKFHAAHVARFSTFPLRFSKNSVQWQAAPKVLGIIWVSASSARILGYTFRLASQRSCATKHETRPNGSAIRSVTVQFNHFGNNAPEFSPWNRPCIYSKKPCWEYLLERWLKALHFTWEASAAPSA